MKKQAQSATEQTQPSMRADYISPAIEAFYVKSPPSVLEQVSVEGIVEDFEDGGDIQM